MVNSPLHFLWFTAAVHSVEGRSTPYSPERAGRGKCTYQPFHMIAFAFVHVPLYHVSAVDNTGIMLVQVEEKLEGGQQKKSLVRRVFARFCTPIFLEVFFLCILFCQIRVLCSVWVHTSQLCMHLQCHYTMDGFFSLYLCIFLMQAFILTFLAEWGDRSQIATIAVFIPSQGFKYIN